MNVNDEAKAAEVKVSEKRFPKWLLFLSASFCWGVLFSLAGRHQWLHCLLCYMMCILPPMAIVQSLPEMRRSYKEREPLQVLHFICGIVSIVGAGLVSFSFFLQSSSVPGRVQYSPLSASIIVGSVLVLGGCLVSYVTQYVAQRRYRRKYEQWERENVERQREHQLVH